MARFLSLLRYAVPLFYKLCFGIVYLFLWLENNSGYSTAREILSYPLVVKAILLLKFGCDFAVKFHFNKKEIFTIDIAPLICYNI